MRDPGNAFLDEISKLQSRIAELEGEKNRMDREFAPLTLKLAIAKEALEIIESDRIGGFRPNPQVIAREALERIK